MANLTDTLRTPSADINPPREEIRSSLSVFGDLGESLAKTAYTLREQKLTQQVVEAIDSEAGVVSELTQPQEPREVQDFVAFVARNSRGVEQGRLSAAEAEVRLNSKLREFSNRYPGLADSFREKASPIIQSRVDQMKLVEAHNKELRDEEQKVMTEIRTQAAKFGINPDLARTDPRQFAERYTFWMDREDEARRMEHNNLVRETLMKGTQQRTGELNLTLKELELRTAQDTRAQEQSLSAQSPLLYKAVQQSYGGAILQMAGKAEAQLTDLTDADIERVRNHPEAGAFMRSIDDQINQMTAEAVASHPHLSPTQIDNYLSPAVAQLKTLKGLLDGTYTAGRLKSENDYLEVSMMNRLYNDPAVGDIVLNLGALNKITPQDLPGSLLNTGPASTLATGFVEKFIPIQRALIKPSSLQNRGDIAHSITSTTDPDMKQYQAKMFGAAVQEAVKIAKQGQPANPEQESLLNAGRNSLHGLATALASGEASTEDFRAFTDILSDPQVIPLLQSDPEYAGTQMAEDVRGNMAKYLGDQMRVLHREFGRIIGQAADPPQMTLFTEVPEGMEAPSPRGVVAGRTGMVSVPGLSYGKWVKGSVRPDGTIMFKSEVDDPPALRAAQQANRLVAPKVDKIIRTWAHLKGMGYKEAADMIFAVSPLANTEE